MMQIPLDELKEEHLQALVGTAENFRIEFKSQLDLNTPAQSLEAAKDISALANSAGGRIFYGIYERKRTDGSRTAERLAPLKDLGLQARLQDVIADTVHPQPHWRVVPVEVEGGLFSLLRSTRRSAATFTWSVTTDSTGAASPGRKR